MSAQFEEMHQKWAEYLDCNDPQPSFISFPFRAGLTPFLAEWIVKRLEQRPGEQICLWLETQGNRGKAIQLVAIEQLLPPGSQTIKDYEIHLPNKSRFCIVPSSNGQPCDTMISIIHPKEEDDSQLLGANCLLVEKFSEFKENAIVKASPMVWICNLDAEGKLDGFKEVSPESLGTNVGKPAEVESMESMLADERFAPYKPDQ